MRHLTITLPADDDTLARAVDALAEHNARLGPLPRLYTAGITYQREAKGREEWRDAREVLASGAGDCEDLAAYRLAERWEIGDRAARAEVRGRGNTKHVYIRRGDGRVEDPSVMLGMRPPPPEFYDMPADDNPTIDTTTDVHAADLADVMRATEAQLGGVNKLDERQADHPDDGADRDDLADGPPFTDAPLPDESPAPAPAPRRSLSWGVRRAGRGAGHLATFKVPTSDGRTLRVTAKGASKRSAMRNAADGIRKLYESPAFRAVLPPQAAALAVAVDKLSRMDPGKLASKARSAATSAARKLAAVFL